MKTLKDFDFKQKRVLLRCDFNVPLDKEKGIVLNDFRIKQSIPTIEYLIDKGAKVILMSHLGRPSELESESLRVKSFSLRPVALRLEKLLNKKIEFLTDCIGEEVKKEIEKMKPGEVVLLENLRFHPEEERADINFAKQLSELGDIYILDGFGACHRSHASIVGIPKFLPSGAGFLLEKEIKALSRVSGKPDRPEITIVGGVKIATKIKVVEKFLRDADHLLLGGGIANVILAVKGILLGRPLPEAEITKEIEKIKLTNPKLHLPVDGIISLEDVERGLREGYIRQAGLGTVRKEERIYDIGPETVRIFTEIITGSEISSWKGHLEYVRRDGVPKTILWSGPLGFFEKEPFSKGTKKIAEAIVRNRSAFKIAGGGDTVSAISKLGLIDKFDHVSTGGGAMLKFLGGEKLPGIEVLR